MGKVRRRQRTATVRVGLPSKKRKKGTPLPFYLPGSSETVEWNEKATLLSNYKSMGLAANPNVRGGRDSGTASMQIVDMTRRGGRGGDDVAADGAEARDDEDPTVASDEDEPDDVRSALGKKRRDGRKVPLQRLTRMQRTHLGPLIAKYKDDYLAMSRDIKLNKMQHSPGALRELCLRFHTYDALPDDS